MSDTSANDVKFSLKVMVNRKERKVLFAEADSTFADVLLSFLTLPLGSIVKILKKHCGDDGLTFGSLTTLYDGLANLDSEHFHTEGAKSILLHPRSSSDVVRKGLKLDISDSPPLEYFFRVSNCGHGARFNSISMYQDNPVSCYCSSYYKITREVEKTNAPTASSPDGVFTKATSSFLITDDLQIVSDTGLFQVVSILGITDMDDVETKNIELGFSDVMDLLKASLISSTPLSDIILYKVGEKKKSAERNLSYHKAEKASSSDSKRINVKVIVQKSTSKLLYAEAEEDFVEFLLGFLIIPLGGAERLLGGNSLIKSIDSLYRSAAGLIPDKYMKDSISRNVLIESKIPHGYISKNHIFPHSEECLPSTYNQCSWSTSIKFPKGQGNYLRGPRSFMVMDDLTVIPFRTASVLSSLKEKKIRISDVEELQLQIGIEEALSILKASLTSTTALTDALLTQTSKKQVKTEA